jgi:predicted transcriptional regulator
LLATKQKRRDKICIIADILDIVRQGALKTQIMYKANLSFTQLNYYLTFLLDYDLIILTYSEGKATYMVTRKGIDYLRKHNELIRIIKGKTEYAKGKRHTQTLIL